MKNRIVIMILCVVGFACNTYGQNQIVPLEYEYRPDNYTRKNGEYFKDTNNRLDNFEGTWIYQNGNTSLTLVLEKKTQQHIQFDNTNCYEDVLIGEYRYVENGEEKINTLSNLQINFNDPYSYNIKGNSLGIYNPNETGTCQNCYPSTLSVSVSMHEPTVEHLYRTVNLWYMNENGNEKILAIIGPSHHLSFSTSYNEFTLPYGEYQYLIKNK